MSYKKAPSIKYINTLIDKKNIEKIVKKHTERFFPAMSLDSMKAFDNLLKKEVQKTNKNGKQL